MTDEQTALVADLFSRYGANDRDCSDIRLTICVRNPAFLDTTGSVSGYDSTACRYIKELNHVIDQLNAYRQALCERYNALATAPTVPVVRLKRRRGGRYGPDAGKVFYYLNLYTRNLNDGTEVKTDSTPFPGTDRHKAISAYNAYVKAHPGIIAEMDIEKPRWER